MILDTRGSFDRKLIRAFEKEDNESIVGIFNGCSIEDVRSARNRRGSTLLHLAVDFDNEPIAKHLISSGLDVNSQDVRLRTALMNALKKRNLSMAKTLLTESDLHDVNVCDAFGMSALRMAMTMDPPPELCAKDASPLRGWLAEYRQLMGTMLDRFEVHCSADSERLASELLAMHCPLMYLVMMSSSDVSCDTMRRMIEQGCAVDQTDFYFGLTALHVAVDQRRVDQMRVLLEAGADPHIHTYDRTTPLGYVYCDAHNEPRALPIDREIDLLRLLFRYKSDWHTANSDELMYEMGDIMLAGSKEALEMALHFNPNLLLLRYSSSTLLNQLVSNRDPGVEQCIKYRPKDVNSRSDDITPIVRAIVYENHLMAECLLDEGACLRMAKSNGITAMHVPFVTLDKVISTFRNEHLSAEGSLKGLMLMLERGGDPQIRFPDHRTFLHVALGDPQRYGHLAEVVLAQLAIRRALGKTISPIIQRQIPSLPKFDSHFDLCNYELAECELNVLYGKVSVFDILVADAKCYAHYARNRAVVARLSTIVIDQLDLNVYYTYVLRKRFARILEIAALREEVEMLLSQTIGGYYGENYIVTQKIVDFLSDEDVRKLVCR